MDFLPLIFQLAGLAIGGPWGALIGAFIGYALFGSMSGKSEGPRLQDLNVQSSAFGAPIPITWGSVRLAGNIIWSPGIREVKRKTKQGSGILGGGATLTTYKYYFSGAIALCEGEITTVRRIWANNRLIYGTKPSDPPTDEDFAATIPVGFELKIYTGSETQAPDPYIEENLTAYGEAGVAPAYRGTAYVVIKDFDLETYGNQVPHFEFEVIRGTPHSKAAEHITTPDRGGRSTGGWDPEEGIYWQFAQIDSSVLRYVIGWDAYTMTQKYLVQAPALFNNANASLSRVSSGRWVLVRGGAIGIPGVPTYSQTLQNSPLSGWSDPDPQGTIYASHFYHPGPMWAQWSPSYGDFVYINFNANGVSGGAMKIGPAACKGAFDQLVFCNYGNPGGWTNNAYGDPGGARAWRLMQESASPTEIQTQAWSWAWGFDLWYRLAWHGAPSYILATNSEIGNSVMTHTYTETISYAGEPSLAHDRTRDKLWMVYVDEDHAARPLVLNYFDMQLSAGGPVVWNNITAYNEYETQYGWKVGITYNPDVDLLLTVGAYPPAGAGYARILGWRPSLANIERLRTGEQPDFLIDEVKYIGASWFSGATNSMGMDTYSRENWIVYWDNDNNSLVKVYFGVPYDDSKVPLSQIVSDICLRCGLESTDIDVTELTDLVQGYALARPTTGRAAIEPLMPGYFFDAVETGEQT